MLLSKLENVSVQPQTKFSCDLFIVYACEERRACHIANTLTIDSLQTFVVGATKDSSFHFHNGSLCKGEIWPSALASLQAVISECGPKKIIIDISCMPRTVVSAIFSELTSIARISGVEIISLYSLAAFSPPLESEEANESIEPVHAAFAGWSSPETKPISLVIGLGYERQKAEGASEFFEPSDQWIFVPNSPVEAFLCQVESNNKNLLDKTDRGRIVSYQVDDPESTYGQLELVVSSLARYSNPVLLPFGPKIFFFLSLVLCLSHPELGVWHVTGHDQAGSSDIRASGEIIGVRCLLSPLPAA